MIPSLEPSYLLLDPPIIFAMVSEIDMIPSFELLLFIHPRATLFLAFKPLDYTRRERKPRACRGLPVRNIRRKPRTEQSLDRSNVIPIAPRIA
jgi:hypothetical protein